MNRKRIILLSMLLLIAITLIYTSYGFFSTKIFGNDTAKLNTFKNNPLSIVYSDSTDTIVGDATESFTPGSTITKTFSVTNPNSEEFNFSISLDEITNTFTRTNDIEYSISLDGEILITDKFPTSTKTVIYNQYIKGNETLNYVLTINYLTSTDNQTADSGAEIGGKLVFNYGDGLNNILIYGNSVQNGTPSPDNPVEINSVGRKSVNLYQPSTISSLSGVTVTYDSLTGVYTINGTTKSIGGNIWLSNNFVPNVASGENVILTAEILSGTIDRNNNFVYYSIFNNNNSKFIRNQDGNFLVKKGVITKSATMITGDYMKFCVQVGGVVTFNNVKLRIQLEKGNSRTTIIPYNKYLIPLKITTTNNLLPTTSSEMETVLSSYFGIRLSPDKNYSMKIKLKEGKTIPNVAFGFIYTSPSTSSVQTEWFTNSSGEEIKTFFNISGVIKSSLNVGFYPKSAAAVNSFFDAYDVMLVEGSYTSSTMPEYVPYNGIDLEILLDEPLRKVGDYADYIDVKNKKVVRNVKEYNLGLLSNWTQRDGTTNTYGTVSIKNPTTTTPILSNRFTQVSSISHIANGKMYGGTTQFSVRLDSITTLEDFNTWLSNNETRIQKVLETPTEETIDVPNLSIYTKDYNNVSVNTNVSPSNVELTSSE